MAKKLIDVIGLGTTGAAPSQEFDPPTLSNENPAPAEINVEIERNIFFRISDIGHTVELNSINVFLQQAGGGFVDVILAGVFQVGFSGTINDVFANQTAYDVDIDPSSFLAENAAIDVRVQAKDTAPIQNYLDVTYTFNTEPPEVNAPFIEMENPARSATGLISTTTIGFRVTDAADQVDSGVAISTLQVQVEDGAGNGYNNAILAGVFVGGFSGTITDVFANGLSYDIVINPPGGGWIQLDRVSIIVDVDDTKS